MKRYAPWVALCAILLAGVLGQTAGAQEPDLTTTVAAPALEAGPVALEPETISAAPSVAPAPEPAPVETGELPAEWTWSDYLKLLALKLLPTFVYVIGGLLLTLGLVATYYLRKHTGINVTAQQFTMYQNIAGLAWKSVEERLRAGILKLPDGEAPKGAQKMEAALDIALEMANELQLPQMARERLQKLIEAALLESRPLELQSVTVSQTGELDDTKLDLPGGTRIGCGQ